MQVTTNQIFDHTPDLTVAEVARALGRSRSWVRDRIADGRLTVACSKPVTAVTWVSFIHLKRKAEASKASPARRAPYLRLVVSNA